MRLVVQSVPATMTRLNSMPNFHTMLSVVSAFTNAAVIPRFSTFGFLYKSERPMGNTLGPKSTQHRYCAGEAVREETWCG